MALTHLLYLSEATRDMTAADLETVRDVSIRNNRARGITGVLLYSAGQFVQLLEGEAEAVRDLFERIRHDPRHTSVRLLVEHEVDRRLFEQWEMGLLDLDRHGEEDRRKLEELIAIAGQGQTDTHGTPIEMVILSRFCMLLPAA